MDIKLAQAQDMDSVMALVEQVRDVFPGLETDEAFMEDSSAICAAEAGRSSALFYFQKKTACCAFWR